MRAPTLTPRIANPALLDTHHKVPGPLPATEGKYS